MLLSCLVRGDCSGHDRRAQICDIVFASPWINLRHVEGQPIAMLILHVDDVLACVDGEWSHVVAEGEDQILREGGLC